jgi:WD40 repeat protein
MMKAWPMPDNKDFHGVSSLSPKGERLLLVGYDKMVAVMDVLSGKPLFRPFQLEPRSVTSVHFDAATNVTVSPTGNYASATGQYGTFFLDLPRRLVLHFLDQPLLYISSDWRRMVTSKDGVLNVWQSGHRL